MAGPLNVKPSRLLHVVALSVVDPPAVEVAVVVHDRGAVRTKPPMSPIAAAIGGQKTFGWPRKGATHAKVRPRRRKGTPMLNILTTPKAMSSATRVQ